MEYEKLEKKISAYIEYLKKEYHLLVSIHFAEEYTYVFSKSKQLLQYNVHQNPYCFMIKNEKKKLNKCILCQKLTLKKCRAHESYTGICHAKVLEYVCRIYTGNKAAGFVSVSGYRDKKVPFGQSEIYDENMKNEEIPICFLDTLISPLCIMLEKLLETADYYDRSNETYYKILDYLRVYHYDISIDKISKKFNFSRSYISHTFKKESGYTLTEFCNILKTEDAKALLENSNLSVTEIALSVGFNNISYFINVFKSLTGVTPLKWRKSRN